MRHAPTVLIPDRRRRLLDELRGRGSAQVEQLADVLRVSASTVRRDLALLEADGLLLRAHGGAYLATGGRPPTQASEPGLHEAMQRIGSAAAEQVVDGMTVMILAGSTTASMVPHLARRSITVVTNGLDIGHALAGHADVELVMLGGVLNRDQMTLLGPMTEKNMADLHVDAMFAGAWGVTPEIGVTGSKVIAAAYHHSMLRRTDSLVVLADGSKFGRRGPTVLADVAQVERFVTDSSAPGDVVDALRFRGATVTVC